MGNVSSRIEDSNRLVEQQKAVLAIALIQNDEFHSFLSDLAQSRHNLLRIANSEKAQEYFHFLKALVRL